MKKYILRLGSLALLFSSCQQNQQQFDASGVFEATEIIVSSKAKGQVIDLHLEEGMQVKANQQVGTLDCEVLKIQKEQLEATIQALKAKQGDAQPQIAVLQKQKAQFKKQIAVQQAQLEGLLREEKRLVRLVNAAAATGRQQDELSDQIAVLKKQLEASQLQLKVIEQQMQAQRANTALHNRGILSEEQPLQKQIAQITAQQEDCKVLNPISGTVISKYIEKHELAMPGKPLYKVANLEEMTLRVYLSATQLNELKIRQKVQVFLDKDANSYREVEGVLSWISDKAEFTPKTIQTKEERVNLVYAAKIKVPNPDQSIKMGMYGEIKVTKQ